MGVGGSTIFYRVSLEEREDLESLERERRSSKRDLKRKGILRFEGRKDSLKKRKNMAKREEVGWHICVISTGKTCCRENGERGVEV